MTRAIRPCWQRPKHVWQNGKTTDQLRQRSHPSPDYPEAAIKAFASATVYMVVRVGRDGHVMDVAPEQVNFTNAVARFRRAYLEQVFVNATASALRRWTFDVPTSGPEAGSAYFLARVPVTFELRSLSSSNKPPAYGSWQPYVPGWRLATPDWMEDQTGMPSALTPFPTMVLHSSRMGRIWPNLITVTEQYR